MRYSRLFCLAAAAGLFMLCASLPPDSVARTLAAFS